MKYKFGNSIKVKENGLTNELTCPNCNKKVQLSVFSNPDSRLKASFPFYEKGNAFILVCPQCSSVFSVDKENGKLFIKGKKLAIGDFDLKEPEKYEC
jgi:transcription elongation factor Elf1